MSEQHNEREPLFGSVGAGILTFVIGGFLLLVISNAYQDPKDEASTARVVALSTQTSVERLAEEVGALRNEVQALRAVIDTHERDADKRFRKYEETTDEFRASLAKGPRFTTDDFEREDKRLEQRFHSIEIQHRLDADRIDKRLDGIVDFLSNKAHE